MYVLWVKDTCAYLGVGIELGGERVVDDGFALEKNLRYC
jgi:hypothetical protein